MTVDQMRIRLTKAYPGPKWKDKVRDMSDNQVIAVYYKFEKSGKLNEKQKKHSVKKEQINKKVSRHELELMEEEGCFAEQLSFNFI